MALTDITWRSPRPLEGFYTSELTTPAPLPVRTFLPTGYEPRYPYPLLVFFHADGGNEEQTLRLAARVSRRNFIAISLRGPEKLGARPDGRLGYGWGDSNSALVEDYLVRAVEQTRRTYHVHSERIYLTGYAEGATQAYRLALTMPDKVGGVISLNGSMPRFDRPLFRIDEMRSLQIFIGHGIANATVPLSLAKADYKALYAAGTQVQMRTYAATHRIHPDMLRDVNRWVVERCCEE